MDSYLVLSSLTWKTPGFGLTGLKSIYPLHYAIPFSFDHKNGHNFESKHLSTALLQMTKQKLLIRDKNEQNK
jgi:hypothetical protein